MGQAYSTIIGLTTRAETFVAVYQCLIRLPIHGVPVPSTDRDQPEDSSLRISGGETIPIVLSSLSDQQALETELPKIDMYACSRICVLEIFEEHGAKVIPVFLQGYWTFEKKHVFWRSHPSLQSVLVSVTSNLQVCFTCTEMQSAYNLDLLNIDGADFFFLQSSILNAKRAFNQDRTSKVLAPRFRIRLRIIARFDGIHHASRRHFIKRPTFAGLLCKVGSMFCGVQVTRRWFGDSQVASSRRFGERRK